MKRPHFIVQESMQHRAKVEPFVSPSLNPIVGGRWSPRVDFVTIRIGHKGIVPLSLDRINDLPGGFHFVIPRKKACIAAEGVEQQPLIGFGKFALITVSKIEFELRLAQLPIRVWHLRLKINLDAFGGLNLDQ